MTVIYQLEFQNPTGESLGSIEDVISLEVTCNFNTIGSAVLVIREGDNSIPFQADTRMHIWRVIEGITRHRLGNTVWLCRKIVRQKSTRLIQLHFVNSVDIVRRRIVAYKSETTLGDKTMDAFDISDPLDARLAAPAIIQAYLNENLGEDAVEFEAPFGYDADRDLSAYLEIVPFSGVNEYLEKQGAWGNLFDVVQEVARVSEEGGVPIWFDIRPDQISSRLQLILWNNYSGVKRGKSSDNPLIFSEEMNNLTELEVTEDYTEEYTVCYVLGENEGTERVVVEVVNEAALRRSPFNRIETTLSLGGEVGDETIMAYEGRAYLQSKRPRRIVTGRLIDTTNVVFGRDYDYGYQVIVDDGTEQFDVHVNNLTVRYENGQEDLQIRMSGESFL